MIPRFVSMPYSSARRSTSERWRLVSSWVIASTIRRSFSVPPPLAMSCRMISITASEPFPVSVLGSEYPSSSSCSATIDRSICSTPPPSPPRATSAYRPGASRLMSLRRLPVNLRGFGALAVLPSSAVLMAFCVLIGIFSGLPSRPTVETIMRPSLPATTVAVILAVFRVSATSSRSKPVISSFPPLVRVMVRSGATCSVFAEFSTRCGSVSTESSFVCGVGLSLTFVAGCSNRSSRFSHSPFR